MVTFPTLYPGPPPGHALRIPIEVVFFLAPREIHRRWLTPARTPFLLKLLAHKILSQELFIRISISMVASIGMMERMQSYVSNKNSLIVPTYFAYFCNFPWGTVHVQNVHLTTNTYDISIKSALWRKQMDLWQTFLWLITGRLLSVNHKSAPYKKLTEMFNLLLISLGSVDVQDNTSRLLSRNMKAAHPRSQIGSNNIIRNQQSLFSFLLSGLEHVL